MTQIRRHTFIVAAAGVLVLTCSSVPAAAFGIGTRGDDVVEGTPDRDMLVGLAGNDAMSGLELEDLILGGRGMTSSTEARETTPCTVSSGTARCSRTTANAMPSAAVRAQTPSQPTPSTGSPATARR
jgi:hypothetical protein